MFSLWKKKDEFLWIKETQNTIPWIENVKIIKPINENVFLAEMSAS